MIAKQSRRLLIWPVFLTQFAFPIRQRHKTTKSVSWSKANNRDII